MKVSIFGLGYVGCVTAGCLARDGHTIIGVDLDAEKVGNLGSGKPTVVEPGLDELIGTAYKNGSLTATTDGVDAVLSSEVSFVCVGTPNTADGSLDLRAVEATAKLITETAATKDGKHLLVMRSTLPAGTCEGLLMPLVKAANESAGEEKVNLVIVPEFLRESTAIADNDDPPFVVVGNGCGEPDEAEPAIEALFGNTTKPIDWLKYAEAELLKATCNVFHALKVAYGNEIGALCNQFSVSGRRLMTQFVKDVKLNISPRYMMPGLPFGGSCLPKDTRMVVALAKRRGLSLPLIESLLPSNDEHLKRATSMIPLNSPRKIGLYGLAFKSGTDDLRESPIVMIAEYLLGKGFDLKIYDDCILESKINGTNKTFIEKHIPHLSSRLTSSLEELADHADVMLATRDYDMVAAATKAAGKAIKLVDLEGNQPELVILESSDTVEDSQPVAAVS